MLDTVSAIVSAAASRASLYYIQTVLYGDDLAFDIYIGSYYITSL